jgi:hypothetical protein
MKRLASGALVAIVGFVATACDPGTHVVAHVVTAGACGADAPKPVEGATVVLHCGGADRPLAVTNAEGRAVYGALGSMTKDCTLEVSREGYAPVTYRVGDVCPTGTLLGHCPHVSLQPVLRPLGAAPQAH